MSELKVKLEKAKSGNRELDKKICHLMSQPAGLVMYTRSVDAALYLVPESKYFFQIESYIPFMSETVHYDVTIYLLAGRFKSYSGRHTCLPIAICLAGLQARELLGE